MVERQSVVKPSWSKSMSENDQFWNPPKTIDCARTPVTLRDNGGSGKCMTLQPYPRQALIFPRDESTISLPKFTITTTHLKGCVHNDGSTKHNLRGNKHDSLISLQQLNFRSLPRSSDTNQGRIGDFCGIWICFFQKGLVAFLVGDYQRAVLHAETIQPVAKALFHCVDLVNTLIHLAYL